jgi:hypothetical protein
MTLARSAFWPRSTPPKSQGTDLAAPSAGVPGMNEPSLPLADFRPLKHRAESVKSGAQLENEAENVRCPSCHAFISRQCIRCPVCHKDIPPAKPSHCEGCQ